MNGNIKEIIGHLVISVMTIAWGACSTGCFPSHFINPNHVNYIKFGYLPKGVETYRALASWRDVVAQEERIDTIIKDEQFIREYVGILNSTSERNDTASFDFRAVALIKMNDDTEHYVCIGDNNGLVIDSQILQDNKQMFDFIDVHLYTKEQWKKFYRMKMEVFVSDIYLQSEQFDMDFDSLYQRYLSIQDYDSYSIAIGDILEQLTEK